MQVNVPVDVAETEGAIVVIETVEISVMVAVDMAVEVLMAEVVMLKGEDILIKVRAFDRVDGNLMSYTETSKLELLRS